MFGQKKYDTVESMVEGCRKGKPRAQQAVYGHFADRMLGACFRYVKNRPEAEDLMITGFTKAFQKISQFSGEGSFEGWLRRIMVNECLMYLRSQKNMQYPLELEIAERQVDYVTVNTELEAQDLLQMIGELPDGYRTVFNLYAIEGYTHPEIAEKLGISEGTSKSQLSKARALLRRMVERHQRISSSQMNAG
jgi:RNA polymerase sigma-70 factor (ECF subfamily)